MSANIIAFPRPHVAEDALRIALECDDAWVAALVNEQSALTRQRLRERGSNARAEAEARVRGGGLSPAALEILLSRVLLSRDESGEVSA